MWIDCEGPHKKAVNTIALDILYVTYKGAGKYAVCASVGSNDFVIRTCDNELAANSEFNQLLAKMKADK